MILYDSFLRQPKELQLTDGRKIKHFYDGSGVLLKTIYYTATNPLGLDIKSLNIIGVKPQNFQFNKIEKIDDFSINIHHAFFRDGDSQIGRWWQIDPKPDVSKSLYSMMDNNAVRFMDMLGDTIILSDAFRNDKRMMSYYNEFINSKAGKNFQNLYRIGGKYGKINVTFDIGKNLKDNPQTIPLNGSNEIIKTGEKTKSPHFIIAMQFANSQKDERLNQILGAKTLIHESQHVQIMTSDLLNGKGNPHHTTQHRLMSDITKNWYKERFGYLNDNKNEFLTLKYYEYSKYLKENGYNRNMRAQELIDSFNSVVNTFDD